MWLLPGPLHGREFEHSWMCGDTDTGRASADKHIMSPFLQEHHQYLSFMPLKGKEAERGREADRDAIPPKPARTQESGTRSGASNWC